MSKDLMLDPTDIINGAGRDNYTLTEQMLAHIAQQAGTVPGQGWMVTVTDKDGESSTTPVIMWNRDTGFIPDDCGYVDSINNAYPLTDSIVVWHPSFMSQPEAESLSQTRHDEQQKRKRSA